VDLHIVKLSIRYGREELLDQMRQMHWVRQDNPAARVVCTISDFDHDPRELYEIPEVRTFCQRLVDIGFIADLDAFTSIPGGSALPLPVGLGALEVWALSQGFVPQAGKTEVTEPMLTRFRAVLRECNRRADLALAEGGAERN
jgi:hypothetical protein